MLLWVELALLLLCIVIGARIGGIGLGTISGIGLVIYALQPGLTKTNEPRKIQEYFNRC